MTPRSNLVHFWFGLAFLALVARHGLIVICNMNLPDSKWNIADLFLTEFGRRWLILKTGSGQTHIFHRRLPLSGLPIVSIRSSKGLTKNVRNRGLMRVSFDGCMVGIVNKDGTPIKKP